ncbi:hypothetical protein HDU91_004663 [Kappamyces sp. JEL0680]|nr:hypothetical protein HDU91_004663 [Kappamyces sp. JEL0680]
MSLFQSDVNITATLQGSDFDDIFVRIKETGTDATVYLTIYPIGTEQCIHWLEGYSAVSDAAVADLSSRIAKQVALGTKIFIRYASEMNGNWFKYGQRPTEFLASWKKVVGSIRDATKGANSTNVAFIWAPNSGNNYPFIMRVGMPVCPKNCPYWDPALDTNGDGLFDDHDDPYTPYYPGATACPANPRRRLGRLGRHVDILVRKRVAQCCWHQSRGLDDQRCVNRLRADPPDIPAPGFIENVFKGTSNMSVPIFYSFYDMFCGKGSAKSSGSKPFVITETAATIHIAVLQTDGTWKAPVNSDASMRAKIKQAWWRQMLNQTFLTTFPKIKAISFFEFIKFEEESWRDFTSLGGDAAVTSPIGKDGADADGATLAAFQADLKGGMDQLIQWSNQIKPAALPPPAAKSGSSDVVSSLVASFLSLFAYYWV